MISKVKLNVFKFVQFLSVDEAEGVSKFLSDATAQWKNLSLEVRSVRSMLEEVMSNWEKHSSTVAALQAWLEDAEQMLNQSENVKRVSTISVALIRKVETLHYIAGAFLFPLFRIFSETFLTGYSSTWT